MNFDQTLTLHTHLEATVFRANGTQHHIGDLSDDNIDGETAIDKVKSTLPFWQRVWLEAKRLNLIPIGLTVAGFAASYYSGDATPAQMALVTTAGVNYFAADFLSGSSARINSFTYIDSGEGTTAASTSDTGLQTPAGTARVNATQSNPAGNQYRLVGLIPFTSAKAITEMGVFSASSSGTLLDRRVFAVINVDNGDSIQFTWTLTIPAGGS